MQPVMGPFEKLRLVLGSVAIAVWVISIVLEATIQDYKSPPSIQLVVLIVAGSLFAPTIVKKANGKDHDESS